MCANATSTASTSPSANTGRSLLSRLTSPLKSRTRNLTDFHIRPDEPYRRYSPGDQVKGAVVLTVVKPIRLTHLTVCLHGFVRVFKHPNEANEPLPADAGLTASGSSRKSQYFGNGHASLFQDEQTLCGEGRLEAGVYEFNFDLDFPRKGLPSSIDFERGTISYMITATITRPTSITATSSCDRKISLTETVDIGPMVPPKPRTISLEPISRRPRRKKTVKTKEEGLQDGTEGDAGSEAARIGSALPDESASQCDPIDHQANPRSPVPSDMQSTSSAATSADSTVSSSTGLSFRLGPVPPSAKSARDSQGTGSKVSAEKTITATIELLKSGCLPGDNLPLKISIKHSKAIKSMHGIIITFYRQGRIDSAPPLSLFGDIKGKEAERLKHEEYYPKSKTGLGGLSLTSAGSSSLFRKDLAQTLAPILVDPVTLTSVVNASVRVPEDVFPTISGVPGQMIGFKYHVEVVVDLGGKLAGQQRHVPRVSPLQTSGTRGDANSNFLAAWGGNIVDTDHIRREKSVVGCLFEVVVGTTDSARNRGRGNTSAVTQNKEWSVESPAAPGTAYEPLHETGFTPETVTFHQTDQQNPYPYYDQHYYDQYPEDYSHMEYGHHLDPHPEYTQPEHAQIPVPLPNEHTDEGMNEKDRLRRAEERLLPSQPPQDNAGPSSSRTIVPPSAPTAPSMPPTELQDDIYDAESETPQAAPHSYQFTVNGASADAAQALPSAPALEDLAGSNAADDKQELERQRLMTEASAPSEFVADEDDNAGEGSSRPQPEPSAPILHEGDAYGGHYAHHSVSGPSHHESLPKYER